MASQGLSAGGKACVNAPPGVSDVPASVRGPVGGASDMILGSHDTKQVLQEKQALREAVVETPAAAPRFPQAPGGCESQATPSVVVVRGPVGGATSVAFGDDNVPEARSSEGPPVGGVASIVLGSDSSQQFFNEREAQRSVVYEAPVAAPRFSQAPGGSESNPTDDGLTMRGPVGGATTVTLGDASAKQIFDERQAERTAVVETPAALQRFPQAPGGSETEQSADLAVAMRGPVGGQASVVLGSANTKDMFQNREAERHAAIVTPDAVPRFSQAPGGNESKGVDTAPTIRGPVGGATGVVLGNDSSEATFAEAEAQRNVVIDTPAAAPRFTQGPGGAESIPTEEGLSVRGPVGGATTVVFGDANTKDFFDERHAQRTAVIDTPAAMQRFPQAPGGAESEQACDAIATRGPVGGATTVVLGSADSKELFGQLEAQRALTFETPDAAPRFTQAPGGNESQEVARVGAVRGPVGGAASVVLGCDDSKKDFDEREAVLTQTFETPAAAPRFTQAPGGAESKCDLAPAIVRGPVGGAASVVLGSDNTKELFDQLQLQQNQVIDTPDPNPRFTQAPGGTESEGSAVHIAMRGPVGGIDAVVLGGDNTQSMFNQRKEEREQVMETPNPTTRFSQVPGGTATVILGGDGDEAASVRASKQILQVPGGYASITLDSDMPVDDIGTAVAPRGLQVHQAPGGTSTICLGSDNDSIRMAVSSNSFANGSNQNCGNTITDRSTTRLHQAPGGTSTICLGADTGVVVLGAQRSPAIDLSSDMQSQECGVSAQRRSTLQVNHAPGGASTICLGTDTSSNETAVSANKFASGSNQNNGNVITEKPTTRIHQGPGGTSTVILGADPATENTAVSANSFANGNNQNCGNMLTERPTTKLHQAPGGTSTICIGDDAGKAAQVSSNSFANGNNQNAGNVITDRSSTRLHQAPGGTSTICLSDDAAGAVTSDLSGNSFANGSNQNCGNVMTGRSSTRLHQAPGGTSTLCLGDTASQFGDENVDKTNVPQETDIKKVQGITISQNPGGNATVLLG